MTLMVMDIDVMSRLSNWGILNELPTVLEMSWQDMVTVGSLKSRAAKCINKPDNKYFYSIDAAKDVSNACSKMATLDNSYNNEILSHLTDQRGIDSGEAVLLSYVGGNTNRIFITGDKRAIKALSRLSISEEFEGKIILIENLLLKYLAKFGRNWLLERLCPNRDLDPILRITLGSNCDNDEPSIKEALVNYISDIQKLKSPPLVLL